jgi:hypothetical protein
MTPSFGLKKGYSSECIPYKDMKTKNAFLEQLNSYQAVLMKRNIEVTLIAGNGEETILSLEVIPSKSSIKW